MLEDYFYKNKYSILFLANMLASACAYFLAFQIRFLDTGMLPPEMVKTLLETLFISVIIDLLFLNLYRSHKIILRYTSLNDLVRIFKAVTCSALTFFIIISVLRGVQDFPRSVFVLRYILGLMLFSGIKVSRRLTIEFWHRIFHKENGNHTLIIGAGDVGEHALREIQRKHFGEFQLVGFLDDDPGKRGNLIHGIPVLDSTENLSAIIDKYEITKVIIAVSNASTQFMRRVVDSCSGKNVNLQILPSFHDALTGKLHQENIRELKVEDLLGRESVRLDQRLVSDDLNGKVVLITGAGGSIGSELVRQIAPYTPRKLILFDIAESPLFEIDREIRSTHPELSVVPFIGDIKHLDSVDHIFKREKPEKVYHAAAYKHVPLMEGHPDEAVLTNIMGTRHLFETSVKYGVDKFIMISTDKAVRPTNVMGATKRCAELMISHFGGGSDVKTKFAAVRFGNVLGSNGSVVPIFQKQIAAGGPVTITHPDITRYFMTIPEAVQLVLQAGALGKGGEVFILDMGEPIKIVDLAKNMIELSGHKVGEDIRIEFTGLRPGEKLYEELMAYGEDVLPTQIDKIRVQKSNGQRREFDLSDLDSLIAIAERRDAEQARQHLWRTIKKYDLDIVGEEA
ncbi:MAG: nucleoside-diphosphate sugar epimerase/dehydratase [Lentisphaeria bacterium]|nr:nucleoside-diphosphate sugar epimerase/dehydratase [Lentisphaeria bacterium]